MIQDTVSPRPASRPNRQPPYAHLMVGLFLVSLMVPIQIYLGGIRLSFYRIILLALFLPALARFFLDPTIRFRTADACVIALSLLGGFALMMTGASVASFGIFIAETMGPYLLARSYIRTASQFASMAKLLFLCIVATIPFAMYENITRDPIILTVLGKFIPALPNVPHEIRFGLDRAQVVFDHPILYGIFCALGFAISVYAVRPGRRIRLNWGKGFLVGTATFMSLSSGAFVAVGLQCCLIGWDLITRPIRKRWQILAIGIVSVGSVLELASNRSLAAISIGFLALNKSTAATRLYINEYAMKTAWQYPWFGIGLYGDWERPAWLLGDSVDNFWVAMMLRHGLPTFFLLLATYLFAIFAIIRARTSDPYVNACRKGAVFTLVGAGIAIITVHLWNSTYCLFMFLIACAIWIADHRDPSPQRHVGPR